MYFEKLPQFFSLRSKQKDEAMSVPCHPSVSPYNGSHTSEQHVCVYIHTACVSMHMYSMCVYIHSVCVYICTACVYAYIQHCVHMYSMCVYAYIQHVYLCRHMYSVCVHISFLQLGIIVTCTPTINRGCFVSLPLATVFTQDIPKALS